MAKLSYGLNVSLDGYADHDMAGAEPGPALFRHFTDHVRNLAGSLYGRVMYETMRVGTIRSGRVRSSILPRPGAASTNGWYRARSRRSGRTRR